MTVPTLDELRRLLSGGELVLLYQAQTDMRTGRAVGVEAVIRWRHPQRGLLHAMEFVTAVPPNGLAREYTQWILGAAAKQMARWRAASVLVGRVAVNTWPESLRPHLVEDVLRAASDAGVEPGAIEIETPPEATYDAATLDVVRALRAAGIRVAWDDFGDGDVRFSSLRGTKFEVIKVPVTFVVGRVGPLDDAAIRSAVAVARSMDASVVAEGVETVASRDRVRDLGCDVGQGYLWSKIVPADEMAATMKAIRVDGVIGSAPVA